MTIWFVYRWRGTSWRKDCWDESDPVGYADKGEAESRKERLLAYHRQRSGKPMYPPPIVWTETPRMRPRPKEQKHRFTLAELNGYVHERAVLQEARLSGKRG